MYKFSYINQLTLCVLDIRVLFFDFCFKKLLNLRVCFSLCNQKGTVLFCSVAYKFNPG